MSPALLHRLVGAVPSLIGLKTAAGDRPGDLAVFVPGHTLASGLALGAHGSYSNVAAVGGWADVGTRPRWPLRGAPDHAVEAARVTAREIIPELFPQAGTRRRACPSSRRSGRRRPAGTGPRRTS